MKKILLLLAVASLVIGCTNKPVEEKEKPFIPYLIDSLTIRDGAENPVKVRVRGVFGHDSTAIINKWVSDTLEYRMLVESIFEELKENCYHPRTFIPDELMAFEITDTIPCNNSYIYKANVLATGFAKNSYGVEGEVRDILRLIMYRRTIVYDTYSINYWMVTPDEPNNPFWMESAKREVGTFTDEEEDAAIEKLLKKYD